MRAFKIYLSLVLIVVIVSDCSPGKQEIFKPKEVYKSGDLIITQVTGHSFIHTSYKQTNDFGNVPCNGLIVNNNNEAIVFDTPVNDTIAAKLIRWIKDTLHSRISAIIPTHFHDDCLGGLTAFHDNLIPSYAYFKTIEFAAENKAVVPRNSFRDSVVLQVGGQNVIAVFFGGGHTKDNVVGYFPLDNILFGGCLIKELKAGKGYLGDADIANWPGTVEKIKTAYPDVKTVVPGHGEYGDKKLLDYTINLFKLP